MSTQVLGVIPARFGSTRFPGKPLALIDGRPLLQWVIEGAQSSQKLNELVVATDHPEIAALAKTCGVKFVMTASDLPTGTDRVFAAAKESAADIVVNIQGDEPLITGVVIDALVEPLKQDTSLQMATMARPMTGEDFENRATAKVVVNKNMDALYFSRLPIPYSRLAPPTSGAACLKHIGLYAFRKSFLQEFCAQPPTSLELAESLEQLRALYLGARLRVVLTDHESVGVDSPEDVLRVKTILAARERVK